MTEPLSAIPPPARPLLLTFLFCALAACAPPAFLKESAPPAGIRLQPVDHAALPGWAADRHDLALAAFRKSCDALLRRPPGEAMGPDPRFGRLADWQAHCRAAGAAAGATPEQARGFFERRFAPYRVTVGGAAEGLITGYFEPELRGAWRRNGPYRHPIYKVPRDLVSANLGAFDPDWRGRSLAGRLEGRRLVPYADRAAIEAGALAGRGLELMWLDDPIDVFFLHVQGSGRVRMSNGDVVRVGFAGRNGLPYTAIGRELVARGAIPADGVSLASIRSWLAANPGEARAVMNLNRSYIFFREIEGDPGGPIGAQGVPLTPGRSLAVDRAHWPLGLPVWLTTPDPRDRARPLARLMIAQDTGSAITGPIRGDFFWGAGDEARAAAGRMQERGGFHVLLPRELGAGS